jgi:hypothetical protein
MSIDVSFIPSESRNRRGGRPYRSRVSTHRDVLSHPAYSAIRTHEGGHAHEVTSRQKGFTAATRRRGPEGDRRRAR